MKVRPKYVYTKNLGVVDLYINNPLIRKQAESDDDAGKYIKSEWLIQGKEYHVFVFDKGILLFIEDGDKVFTSDIYFLPEKRGLYAYRAAEIAIRFMFNRVRAKKLTARIASCNRPSIIFCRRVGFQNTSVEKDKWIKDGASYDVMHFARERQMGSILGGGGSSAAKSAANAQENAAREAADVQREMFNKTEQNLNPYMLSGSRYGSLLESILTGIPLNQTANYYTSAGSGSGGTGTQPALGGGTGTGGTISGSGKTKIPDSLVNILPENMRDWVKGKTVDQVNQMINSDQWRLMTNNKGYTGGAAGTGAITAFANSINNLKYLGNTTGVLGTGQPGTGQQGSADWAKYGAYAGAADGRSFGIPEVDNYQKMQAALGQGDYSQFFNSPDYQFALQEGLKSTERAGSARGMTLSGRQNEALQQYGQGLASQQFGNYYNRTYGAYTDYTNRLQQLAGSGQNAAAHLGSLGATAASNIAGQINNAGAATASGIVGGYNANQQFNQNLIGAAGGSSGLSGGILSGTLNSIGSSLWSKIGGSIVGALGGPISDMRLKENIKYLGKENGHKMYEFSYIGNPRKFRGVMAQDLLKYKPEAVIPVGDILTVDYSLLGVEMTEVA